MTPVCQKLTLILCTALAMAALAQDSDEVNAGPFYSDVRLTLTSGYRTELGPLFYSQESGAERQWGLPPFFSRSKTADVDWSEWEFLYPVVDYRRFGDEYRVQFVEFLAFSGGKSEPSTNVDKFTIFPVYFRQRAKDTNLNYTAVVPFYGEIKNRLFRDDIKFILFPAYSETRKKDVVTDNYLYPFFDVRHGDHLTGWQFWPLVGVEHKDPTWHTNNLDEVVTNGGYDKFFAAFPFYFKGRSGMGTTNEETNLSIIPFYLHSKSPAREQTSYGWPLGYNVIDDREQKYVEHDVLWPIIVNARGDKEVTRVFPFYSQAHNHDLESDFYMWPIYKFNRLKSPPLERTRTRILFFLYSDINETNASSHSSFHRVDFWPFYTYRKEPNGDKRLQVIAFLEPFFPNNRAVTREYSHFWSLWRDEENHKTGATSQSLLWNFYRRDTTPHSKNFSLLFGLFQYQSGAEGRRWRVCYMTVKKEPAQVPAPKS